jgi:uncharacterized protein YndB with AHSA1/START domain
VDVETHPVMTTGLLIRKPAAEVFEAFADPAITSKFWFSKGDVRLEANGNARWDWEMYGAGTDVTVKAIEPARRILIEWGSADEGYTTVEWTFEPRGEAATMVTVVNSGFTGTGDEIVAKALDSMGGFNLVLGGAKIWLEHGIAPNFVLDRHPDALVEGWRPKPD